jgi:hypothetical protein
MCIVSLQVLPQWAKDLLTHQPDVFDAAFHRSFAHQSIDTSSETSVWLRTVVNLDKVVL